MTEWLKVLIWNVSFTIVNEGSNPSFSMKLKEFEPLRKNNLWFLKPMRLPFSSRLSTKRILHNGSALVFQTRGAGSIPVIRL